ncbi:hypothetical protein llap_15671 [Limosa lapponica baueri]|uniref:Uncharacterized protein n=1 Tax=Limosa lapponica baueri TaxID=1758121 RepID=A0A2I0TJT0_LIMLA|nr:hypothetical protein llap_15671 [Limosa lapponica baueri]
MNEFITLFLNLNHVRRIGKCRQELQESRLKCLNELGKKVNRKKERRGEERRGEERRGEERKERERKGITEWQKGLSRKEGGKSQNTQQQRVYPIDSVSL